MRFFDVRDGYGILPTNPTPTRSLDNAEVGARRGVNQIKIGGHCHFSEGGNGNDRFFLCEIGLEFIYLRRFWLLRVSRVEPAYIL